MFLINIIRPKLFFIWSKKQVSGQPLIRRLIGVELSPMKKSKLYHILSKFVQQIPTIGHSGERLY
jgi:hypothetical protein